MAKSFTVGGIHNLSFDIEVGGDWLYIAALDDSSNPKVLRLKADLSEDATDSFDPGSGSEIQLQCGNLVAEKAWAVGDFASPELVVQYDAGNEIYWYSDPESETWTGPIRPVLVGYGNDNLVMVSDPDSDILYESYFINETGPYWLTLGDELPFDINAFDRLDIDLNQILIGIRNTDPYFYSQYFYPIQYSPNRGEEFSDISGALSGVVFDQITTIIFGS